MNAVIKHCRALMSAIDVQGKRREVEVCVCVVGGLNPSEKY